VLHAILLLQLAVPPSQSPAATEAARLVHASINDYELGFFDKALHEAEEAYRLAPLPQILFNIGQCHKALKHWERAAFYYEKYLAKIPDAPNRAKVEDLLTEVTYRLKAEQLPAPPAQPAPVPPAATPAPAPVLVISSAPLSATTPEAVPPAAIDVVAEPHHSHTASWILGSVAIACVATAVVGIVEVENYESFRGTLSSPASYTYWEQNSPKNTGMGQTAQIWEVTAIITGAVALATGTAAAFTW